MIIRVKLFAVARQRIGKDEIEVQLPDDLGGAVGNCVSGAVGNAFRGVPGAANHVTTAHLRAAIARQHPQLVEILASSRLAVNNEYACDKLVLPREAEIALIPPVSGG